MSIKTQNYYNFNRFEGLTFPQILRRLNIKSRDFYDSEDLIDEISIKYDLSFFEIEYLEELIDANF